MHGGALPRGDRIESFANGPEDPTLEEVAPPCAQRALRIDAHMKLADGHVLSAGRCTQLAGKSRDVQEAMNA
jgi:hypothetical protein